MKLALLYSGAIRGLAETLQSNLEYFSRLSSDIDLYFSVWDHMGYVDKINSPDYIRLPRKLPEDTVVTEQVIKNLLPNFQGKVKIKVESFREDLSFELDNGFANNLAAQYYKVHDCFALVEQPEQYECLGRMRCDLLLDNKITKEDFQSRVEDNKLIFTSKIWFEHESKPGIKEINEMMWFGKPELVEKTCNIYKNVDKINHIIRSRKQTNINFGENVCYANLEAEGLADSLSFFDFDYKVIR